MSTYLVAYVVSDFLSISNVTKKGIRVEVAGRPEAIQSGDGEYALSEACKIMDYFVDYYNVSYPLQKSSNFIEIKSRMIKKILFKLILNITIKLKLQYLILAKAVTYIFHFFSIVNVIIHYVLTILIL